MSTIRTLVLKIVQQLYDVFLSRVISRSEGYFLEKVGLLSSMESFCDEDFDSYTAGKADSGQDFNAKPAVVGVSGVSRSIHRKPNGSIASPA